MVPRSPICLDSVSMYAVEIPFLERVLMCDPFLINVHLVPTLFKILGLYRFTPDWPILETKSQILRIGLQRVLKTIDGLKRSILIVY